MFFETSTIIGTFFFHNTLIHLVMCLRFLASRVKIDAETWRQVKDVYLLVNKAVFTQA